MSQAYISQIMAYGFNFAPKSWAFCNGQTLPISQNTALFSLLGTTYGGNGTTTFDLPNLQSRVPIGFGTSPIGQGYALGQPGGEENVTLTINQMPAHTHLLFGTNGVGNSVAPRDAAVLAAATKTTPPGDPFYAPQGSLQSLNAGSISMVGGNGSHPNLQPYLALNWCICQYGVFPSRN
jgi:microcystin-dependent protein